MHLPCREGLADEDAIAIFNCDPLRSVERLWALVLVDAGVASGRAPLAESGSWPRRPPGEAKLDRAAHRLRRELRGDAETTAPSGPGRCGPGSISEGQRSDTIGSRKGGPASLPAHQVVLHVLLAELDERPAAANVVPHAGGKAAARAQNSHLISVGQQVFNVWPRRCRTRHNPSCPRQWLDEVPFLPAVVVLRLHVQALAGRELVEPLAIPPIHTQPSRAPAPTRSQRLRR